MTLRRILATFLLTSTFWVPTTFAQEGFTEAELTQMAKAFIEAKNARQQPDSDAEDIERFLALFAEDFVDEHIKFNVTVTDKGELREGMLRKLEDEVLYSRIEIKEIMTGHNVVFVKYLESAKVKPAHLDEVIEYTSTNIVSLEFDAQGLIKHLRRHHG
ncbi:MAG: nuclear transport factor 2 family protein [Pseudomonadota bacterium]